MAFRFISRKGLFGSSNWISGKRVTRGMRTAPGGLYSSPPPWLMLPPEFGPGDMSFKFYSLPEKKVLTVSRELNMLPKEDVRLKGSSHGWLSYLNHRSHDLFLYNPISSGRINLPPAHTLPNFTQDSLDNSWGDVVNKLIISSAPEDDQHDCRALITYNKGVAFCCPGRCNDKWTLIPRRGRHSYTDCLYWRRRKVFLFLTSSGELETWDLNDPCSPRKIPPLNKEFLTSNFWHLDLSDPCSPKVFCDSEYHVVVTENDDVLVVTRYLLVNMLSDGSLVEYEDSHDCCPNKTVVFAVQKYDPEEGDFQYVDGSCLDGMAIFIGFYNHSSVLSTTEFPELKPNSIYFTDALENFDVFDEPYGGHDIGIFDFKDKTMSQCYYPCDIRSMRRIVPSPMWFFPSQPI